jgi:hypothetical protein
MLKNTLVTTLIVALGMATGSGLLTGTAFADEGKKAERSFPLTEKWSLERVLSLSRAEIIKLFKTLDPPALHEMNGHYMGLVPNGGDAAAQKATGDFMYNEKSRIGFWLGKAYKPTSATKGEGYNRWRLPNDVIVINQRFGTEIGKSLIDGKPSFMMYYGHYRHELIPEGTENTLTDEIRKLDDNIYIGMGTTDAGNGKRSEPGHFMLIGPTDAWVGVPDVTMEKK